MSDPVFLDLEDVLLIHEEQLATYAGPQAFAACVLRKLPRIDINDATVPSNPSKK